MADEITLEDRVKDIQIDLKHMKNKLDIATFYIQKISKDGLKVKK